MRMIKDEPFICIKEHPVMNHYAPYLKLEKEKLYFISREMLCWSFDDLDDVDDDYFDVSIKSDKFYGFIHFVNESEFDEHFQSLVSWKRNKNIDLLCS
jgi:hypothetical protein